MAQYRTIWILRGDIHVEESPGLVRTAEEDYLLLVESYRRHTRALDSKRYNLSITTNATSKTAFLQLIKDPDTVAIAWHSHADRTGTLYAAGRATITADDIKRSSISPNLCFVALIGCLVGRNKDAWVKAFKLDRLVDGKLRLAASEESISLYTDTSIVTKRDCDSWAKVFVEKEANAGERLRNYHFPDWVNLLSPVSQEK